MQVFYTRTSYSVNLNVKLKRGSAHNLPKYRNVV